MRPHEVKLWMGELKKNRDSVYWKLAKFMVLTGARVVRVASWSWNIKEPYLSESTKTSESARLLMLSEDLIETLKVMKKKSSGDLVFSDKKGKLLKINTIRGRFNKAFKTLGLPWRSTHICHHTYANKGLICCASKSWTHRSENDPKVRKSSSSFKLRNSAKNS